VLCTLIHRRDLELLFLAVILVTGISTGIVSAQYEFVTAWGSHGTGPGQFDFPRGIAFDNPGNVYIVDQGNDRVQVFSPEGKFLRQWGSSGDGEGQFNCPFGLLVSHGQVYVTDTMNNRVQVFLPNGTYVSQWDTGLVLGNPSSGPDTPFTPLSICANVSGYFYVGGFGGIKVYSPGMNYIAGIGSFGKGEDQMESADGVAFNSTGYLFATDSDDHRVQVISPGNEFVTRFGELGSGPGQFLFPMGLAIADNDRMFITDVQNNRIQVFDPSGAFRAEWGSEGTGPGQFGGVTGIAIVTPKKGALRGQELVYTTELLNDRVQVFALVPPGAGFSGAPTKGSAPLTVQFTDTSSGPVTSYAWDFGDGETSISQNPVHTYLKSGKYTVTLTASNSAGSTMLAKKNYITVTKK
jgi:hypothetical protein